MKSSLRVVTRIPLGQLWNELGELDAHPICRIGLPEIATLLKKSDTSFVVADVGLPLRWIPGDERFAFWKSEVTPRLVSKEAHAIQRESYPGEYCYVATHWELTTGPAIVVFERFH